ncbi:DUF4430 domain-containing protein [Virgibacillus oceani]
MERYKGINSSFIVFIATILLLAQSSIYSIPTVFADTLTNGVTITALDEEGDYVVETEAVSFEEGETAFDVLDDVAEVDYEESEYGPFITGVEKHEPEEGHYWGFFNNGSSSDVGAGTYELENGDNLLFKVVDEEIWPNPTIDVKVSAVDLDGEEILAETNVDIVEFGTAYDALVQATKQEGINLDVTVDSDLLTFVNDLDDRLNDSAYWAMYLNNDFMSTGLVGYQMQEGDHLELAAEFIDEGQGNDGDSEDEQESDGETEEEPGEPENQSSKEITLEESIEKSADYLVSNDNVGWYGFIALNALGKEVSRQTAENSVGSVVSNEGNFGNVTDTSRNILILTAGGKDATDIEGYNLVDKLTNHERMENQGNNGPIYSLLALNSGNYDTTEDATWTKDRLIQLLLGEQLDDGGWALFGSATSVDLTGMALTALAPYQDDPEVKDAIDDAVNYLSEAQADEGGYPDPWHGGDSAPSIAMAIIGLASVGVDPTSPEFTKEGGNLIQRLLQFQNDDGGFSQNVDGNSNNPATDQALLGLAAYKFLNNDGSVFQFSVIDEDELEDGGEKPEEEKPEKEEEKPEEETSTGKTEKIINPTITINKDKNEMVAHIDLDDISDITENEVIVQPENASDQLVFDVEISNTALNKLVDTNSDLTIDKGDVEIHIPNMVLQQFLEEAGDQQVNIKLVRYESSHALGPVYDITITAGNKAVTDFNGNEITLTFHIDQELAANIDSDRIKVFYFNEEIDEWEVIENSVYDPETGLVTAKTTHFTIFGVFELGTTTDVIPTVAEPDPIPTTGEDETGENGSTGINTKDGETGNKLPNTATNSFNFMLIGLALLLTGITIFIVKRRMQLKS